jgi:hypothetical protein
MADAKLMTTKAPSRRALLAGAPTIAARAVVAGTVVNAVAVALAKATEVDPAVAVADEYHRASEAYNQAVERNRALLAEVGELAEVNAAFDVLDSTSDALFDVTPTTIAGAAALLEALAFYDKNREAEFSALEWRMQGADDAGAAVNDMLLAIANVLRQNAG